MSVFLKYLVIVPFVFCFGCTKTSNTQRIDIQQKIDTLISLENDGVKLTFSLLGGALVEFQDKKSQVNPYTWKLPEKEMPENNKKGAVFQGHFLCTGRWGSPTPGEMKLGMPYNGELSNNWWKLESNKKNGNKLRMDCEAPLDAFTINREITLSQIDPLIKVVETINNDLAICRINTIIQHATIGQPFLDKNLIINSNAKYGYNQSLVIYGLDKYEYLWPRAYIDTLKIATIDLTITSRRFSYISSHIFSDTIGWVTAANPPLKLMLGYTWKTSEYPWLNIWNGLNNGKLWVKGLLFGTTGLGDKYSFENRITTTFHGVKNIEVIDAKGSLTKSYFCFLISIPDNYEQTLDVLFENDQVTIKILTSDGVKNYKLTL